MNTCKTALRILKSRKMYLVIYLGFIGIMMFAISWQIMRDSMTGGDEVFHPDTARVAVVDRDGDADGISSALRSYLALDGEMVDLAGHGLLHLLGYDHMVEEDKVIMRAKEEEALREIELSEEFLEQK